MTRLLWVVAKQFDRSPDTATWLEMIASLRLKYDVFLLTGYRYHKVQPLLFKNNIYYYESLNIPIINRLTTYITQLYAFFFIMKFFRPNVVLFNISNPLLLRQAVVFKKRYGISLLFDVRTLPVEYGKTTRHIDRYLLGSNLRYATRYFDGVTYITEEMKRYCISRYNLPFHHTVVWTSGVNPDLFAPVNNKPLSPCFNIIYHGTIAKNRGLDSALEALTLLKNLDIRMVLLGGGDGVEELKLLATKLGILDKVLFFDTVEYREVPHWINTAHVGILPFPNWTGWNTSSPIKLFEYLACGKAVIVTNIPAHTNVLHGCDFAFWAKDSSPEAIAEAISQAYYKRFHLAAFGHAAREFVLKYYTWNCQAQNLHNFLNEVLERNPLKD
jgi:glycosyltransferase involved in cell wall biosynthesis